MADDNINRREEFHYPKPDPQRDKQQRGDDPANLHRDDGSPQPPPLTPEQKKRRDILEREIDNVIKERPPSRQDGIWPYLLIRAYLGDHGVRPAPGNYFWESPDIIVCRGVLSDYDSNKAVLHPTPGQPHTVFVRVWNVGRMAAYGVTLRMYWANPSFAFSGTNLHPLDPTRNYPTPLYLNLPDRRDPGCHALFRVPDIWTPVVENGGHECLLAKVDCFTDHAGPGWDANANRHVGQHNVDLAAGAQNLMPLLAQLGGAMPRNTDLQLLHGMKDVRHVLQASAPELANRLRIPRAAPTGSYRLDNGYAHLGAVVYSDSGKPYLIPADVVGPRYNPTGVDHTLLANPAVRPITGGQQPLRALVKQAGSDKQPRGCLDAWLPTAISRLLNLVPSNRFTAAQLAQRLGARSGEGHLIRIVASNQSGIVGGYSIIVQGLSGAAESLF
ncbi:MAG: hypothetical protein DLM69_03355 [Candidatus Chloroheliales bacterium]|nr:MAG: hypothetical protein DLM69_03355 [Chloroflexota bacterium]